ncbi:MAG: hypothetical protein AB7G11_13345 [Phycisphaerales bacterium]
MITTYDNYIAEFSEPGWQRVIYSPTGGADSWCMIQRGDEGVARGLIVGDSIYMETQPGQTDAVRLFRFPKPARVVTCRPLLVGSGGQNFVKDSFDAGSYGNGHDLITIDRDTSGNFVDPDTMSVISPPPPTRINRILLVKGTPRSVDDEIVDSAIGQFVVDRVGGDMASPAFTRSANQALQRCLRTWILDATGHELQRSKTTGFVSQWSSGVEPDMPAGFQLQLASRNRWTPVVCSNAYLLPENIFAFLRTTLYSTDAGNSVQDAQRYYLAPEFAGEDTAVPGYPLPPHASGSSADEDAKVVGFSIQNNWTLFLAGMVGDATWDQCFYPLDNYTLYTLYGNSTNHIRIIADTQQRRLLIIVAYNGDARTFVINGWYWVRDSALLLGLAYSSSTQKLTIVGSLAGGRVQTATQIGTGGVSFNSALTELQCRDTVASTVREFRTIGGKIIDDTTQTEAQMKSALVALDFLP